MCFYVCTLYICAMGYFCNYLFNVQAGSWIQLRRVFLKNQVIWIFLKVCFSFSVSCQEGFAYYRNNCFAFFLATLNWDDAQADCASKNAALASIHNQDENDFVLSNSMKTSNNYLRPFLQPMNCFIPVCLTCGQVKVFYKLTNAEESRRQLNHFFASSFLVLNLSVSFFFLESFSQHIYLSET